MAKKGPKVTVQKVVGETGEWIVWVGTRWAGVVKTRRGKWFANRKGCGSKKEAVAWLVGK